MVNNQLFSKRLQQIMDFYQLNASALADKLAIQRSSISHILSGRNKPSLDFVLKIIHEFSDVDFYWLLLGKGSFPKTKTLHNEPPSTENPHPTESKIKQISSTLFDQESVPSTSTVSSEIERIVIFYSDGTFANYNPK